MTDEVIIGILPCLKRYMNETRSEMLEDVVYLDKTKSKKVSKLSSFKVKVIIRSIFGINHMVA
jgi:hypothetical protein